MKKLLSVILAVMMILAVVPMAAFAEDIAVSETTEATETTEETTEKIVEIVIDFVYPAAGKPAYTDYMLDGIQCTLESARWFEASSDQFIDEGTPFSAGEYYIEATFKAQDGFEFAEGTDVIINGAEALDVQLNEDGTLTAVGGFTVEAEESDDILSFIQRLINTVKTVFFTIVRFFGTMIGLK